MNVRQTELPGVLILEPQVFGDQRGCLFESWSSTRYEEAGIAGPFVQDNIAFSRKEVLRGLHFQHPHSQGKLVQALSGDVFDVVVDVRVGSPTFGRWVAERLSEENRRQIYVPSGLAHGYCVLSETALFSYKCTDFYSPASEMGIIWNDPDLKIDWPIATPVVSAKDARCPRLRDIPARKLPRFGGI